MFILVGITFATEQLQYDKWYINVIHQHTAKTGILYQDCCHSALPSLGSWAHVATTTWADAWCKCSSSQERMGTPWCALEFNLRHPHISLLGGRNSTVEIGKETRQLGKVFYFIMAQCLRGREGYTCGSCGLTTPSRRLLDISSNRASTQLCPTTLCTMDCSPSGSFFPWGSQARNAGVVATSSRDLPIQGRICISSVSSYCRQILYLLELHWEAPPSQARNKFRHQLNGCVNSQ